MEKNKPFPNSLEFEVRLLMAYEIGYLKEDV